VSDPAELAPLLEMLGAEAQQESEQLLAAARSRADEIREKAEEQARAMLAGAAGEGRAEGEREVRRRVARAQLEVRQQALVLRDEALERVLERAAERLRECVDGPEGERLLGEWVASAASLLEEAELRLRVRVQGRESVATGLPGVAAELVLDDEPITEPGAVVSSLDGRRTVDMTLPAIVRRRREASRRAAARVLFGDGSPA
jgi:vacuolar-type H+-ATPase subunit E/Vma4